MKLKPILLAALMLSPFVHAANSNSSVEQSDTTQTRTQSLQQQAGQWGLVQKIISATSS